MRTLSLVTVSVLIAVLSLAQEAHAQTAGRISPPGFREESAGNGVTLWRKGKEYVQIVSPHRGAKVVLLNGKMIPSEGQGTNFMRMDMREWWDEWSEAEENAFTLMNGQFFNMNDSGKSPLAFATKINGIVYPGYGDFSEYPGKKMLLRIGSRHATVEPFDDDAGSLYTHAEPDIIVGLRPDVSKSGNVRRGRTFMGTMPNGNLILFTSPAATQRYATRIVTAFGADRDKIMMLDGGGSTQFIHQGKLVIPKTATVLRTVPLAIGVTKAP